MKLQPRKPHNDLLERAPIGLNDYKPQVEPEYVWLSNILVWGENPTYRGGRYAACLVSEVGAWRQRAKGASHPHHEMLAPEPSRYLLADVFATALREDRHTVYLLDDEGKEIRRWEL